jgi:hypothetical protein
MNPSGLENLVVLEIFSSFFWLPPEMASLGELSGGLARFRCAQNQSSLSPRCQIELASAIGSLIRGGTLGAFPAAPVLVSSHRSHLLEFSFQNHHFCGSQ